MKRHIVVSGTFAFASMLALALTGGTAAASSLEVGAPQPALGAGSETQDPFDPAEAEGPRTAAEQLSEFATAHNSPGVFLNADGSVLVRIPEGDDSEFLSPAALARFGVAVDRQPSKYSMADLESLQPIVDSIYRDGLESQKHSLGYTYYPETDALVITSAASREEIAALLNRLPGAVHEVVDVAGQVGQPRHSDTSPFKGAAAIYNSSSGDACSSAMRVTNGAGGVWMLTAAHCSSATGNTVRSTSTGPSWGTITTRLASYDLALIGGLSSPNYSGVIYTGSSSTSSSTMYTLGAVNPVAGTSMCRGDRSGTTCGHIAGSGTSYQCYTGGAHSVCAHLFAYTGGTLSIGGDSGGMVYTNVVDVGVTKARFNGVHTALGGSTMYAVPYSYVNATLGVYMYTTG